MLKAKAKTSHIWSYFQICDSVNRKAICKHCKNILSYKSTITNLKLHLKKMHIGVYEEFCRAETTISINTDEDSDDSSQQYPDIWSYFERESGARARCAVCRATMPGLRALLTKHLKEKHPKLIAAAADGETEIVLKDEIEDDDQEMYTEVVYLEEEAKDNAEEKRRKERRKRNVVECKPIRRKSSPVRLNIETPKKRSKRRETVSSDEIPIKNFKKPKINDDDYEIESFGKYITCLLKKLPRSVCRQLQMNIVNLIMSANLNEESNKTVETVPFTIQRLPFQTVPGTSYLVVNDKDDVHNVTLNTSQLNNVQSHVTIGTSGDVPTSTALASHSYTAERDG